jgi:putative transposase
VKRFSCGAGAGDFPATETLYDRFVFYDTVELRGIGGTAEYRDSAHATFDLKCHVVWCTKYRYKILSGRVAERARDLIRQVCQSREVVIIRGAVSPDHVHVLLSAPPVLSPAKLAPYIKGRSSRLLQAEFAELRKRYWGQHIWARGYFCATVGAVDEATIKA